MATQVKTMDGDTTEIEFTSYQSDVFVAAENLIRENGYLGEALFEDTYVLQKKMAEYVINNVPLSGQASSISGEALDVYNDVLEIITPEVVIPATVSSPRRSGSPTGAGKTRPTIAGKPNITQEVSVKAVTEKNLSIARNGGRTFSPSGGRTNGVSRSTGGRNRGRNFGMFGTPGKINNEIL